MTTNTSREFNEKFATFLKGCQDKVNENHKRFANLTHPWFEVKEGKRYIKIVQVTDWNRAARIYNGADPNKDLNDRRVHVFVDKTNGDVLKAESFRKPAKYARGNIFDDSNGMDAMGTYGAKYMDQLKNSN